MCCRGLPVVLLPLEEDNLLWPGRNEFDELEGESCRPGEEWSESRESGWEAGVGWKNGLGRVDTTVNGRNLSCLGTTAEREDGCAIAAGACAGL